MDKITMANALKAVFGTSITPTSSQYVPITASDGTPAGISSMANLASVLGVMPLAVDTNKEAITLAKEYFSTMSTTSVRYIKCAAHENAFALILKDTNTTGRIELYGVATGTTTIYKKGYNDNDWVLLS